ncbi:MAG TPA: HEPN domain-containing protein [Thermoplasmata archaeon]|nr:HEPN domain-containing protein [Thermoplasmata archaeon]
MGGYFTKPFTREWVDKAEADRATALRESKVRSNPNRDAVCFHAQQCAEKYLKAFLQESGVAFPKVHDLVALATLCESVDPEFATLKGDAGTLIGSAVEVRYPGKKATAGEAKSALAAAQSIRRFVRARL